MSSPYEGLQDFVAGLPELVQPLLVAAIGAIPYVEGEGSASIGIIVGINPIVAAIAGATGNILSVLAVIALTARARAAVVSRRSAPTPARTQAETAGPTGESAAGANIAAIDLSTGSASGSTAPAVVAEAPAGKKQSRTVKGQKKLGRWLVRFGVPGASILAPLALPTQLTAAFFVASGVRKGWVLLWQVVAIVVWTGLVAAAATGLVNLLGWTA